MNLIHFVIIMPVLLVYGGDPEGKTDQTNGKVCFNCLINNQQAEGLQDQQSTSTGPTVSNGHTSDSQDIDTPEVIKTPGTTSTSTPTPTTTTITTSSSGQAGSNVQTVPASTPSMTIPGKGADQMAGPAIPTAGKIHELDYFETGFEDLEDSEDSDDSEEVEPNVIGQLLSGQQGKPNGPTLPVSNIPGSPGIVNVLRTDSESEIDTTTRLRRDTNGQTSPVVSPGVVSPESGGNTQTNGVQSVQGTSDRQRSSQGNPVPSVGLPNRPGTSGPTTPQVTNTATHPVAQVRQASGTGNSGTSAGVPNRGSIRQTNGVQQGQVTNQPRQPVVSDPQPSSQGNPGTRVVPQEPTYRNQQKVIEDVVGREVRSGLRGDGNYTYREFETVAEKTREKVGQYLLEAIEKLVEVLIRSKYDILTDHATIVSDIQNTGVSYHESGLKLLNGIKFTDKNEIHDLLKGFNGLYYRVFMRLNDLRNTTDPAEAMKIVGSLNVIPQSVAMELERSFPSARTPVKTPTQVEEHKSDNYVATGYKLSLLVTKDILRKIDEACLWFAKLSNYIYKDDVVLMAKTRLSKVPHPKNLTGSAIPKPPERKVTATGGDQASPPAVGSTSEGGSFQFGEVLDEMGMRNLESFVRAQEEGIINVDGTFVEKEEKEKKKPGILGAIKRKIHELTASGFETMSILVPAGILSSVVLF